MTIEQDKIGHVINDIVSGRMDEQADSHIQQLYEEYQHGDAASHLKKYDSYDPDQAYDAFINNIEAKLHAKRRRRIAIGYSLIAAAVVASLFIFVNISRHDIEEKGVTTVENVGKVQDRSDKEVAQQKTIPFYSTSKPKLVLPNGDVVILSDDGVTIGDAKITTMGNTISVDGGNDEDLVKLSIPRGRQYDLELSDGTHVWLNSETTLSFPLSFSGDRQVAVTGQAFFDVSHTGTPFRVQCSKGVVKVMGTTFDVRDYAGETTSVTLVSGSVAYATNSETTQLHPGEQAVQEPGSQSIVVQQVDTRRFTAWKDGMIYFKDERLEDVMSDIERMYDVNIVYSDNYLRDMLFTGECSRFKNVDEFMKLLQMTGLIEYKKNGKTIILSY
ncbi:MAG: DUF4974 domain-containing protein [Prevotella sp.]|nr:DUF4974 domain-containing protein [Prevotella sp.]